jgi:hypothetical protein
MITPSQPDPRVDQAAITDESLLARRRNRHPLSFAIRVRDRQRCGTLENDRRIPFFATNVRGR